MRAGGYWRLFIAVPLPHEVQRLIGDIQMKLDPLDWPFRWVEPDLAHITLKFFGDTNPRLIRDIGGKLAWAASRTEPVTLNTSGIGAFPTSRRPRVAWIGLEGDVLQLERLAEDVDEVSAELGFDRENRRFRPHVTIGRLRHRAEPPPDFEMIVNDLGLPARQVPVDRIQLIRSVLGPGGLAYAVIDEWLLGQEARAPRALDHG